jgi:copper chaperone CopZ
MAKAKTEIKIEGMTCQGCVRSIEKKLSAVRGVGSAHVNLGAGKAVVEYDDSLADPSKLMSAVDEIGFHASQP